MNGRSAFNASPCLGFLPFLAGQWGWCSPWDPLSPRLCREFTPNPAGPGSCGPVPIRRLRGAPMQVSQDVARCWLQTPGLFWKSFRATPWPCRLKPVVFSSVGAGLHRSAVPEPLPALLLRGDWSCQVLIWSLPWRRSRPARRLTFTRGCSAKALGRKI